MGLFQSTRSRAAVALYALVVALALAVGCRASSQRDGTGAAPACVPVCAQADAPPGRAPLKAGVGGIGLPPNVSASDTLTATWTGSGSPPAHSYVAIATNGIGNVGVAVAVGGWTGTLQFEATYDGSNWFSVFATPIGNNGLTAPQQSTTLGSQWVVTVGAAQQVRARCSSLGAGTPYVALTGNVAGTFISGQMNVQRVDGAGNVTPAGDTSARPVFGQEVLAPQAENNANAVIAFAFKPLAVSTYAPSLFTDYAADATKNVKASAGNVLSLSCVNANASTRYIQLHNTATTPSGGAVPLLSFAVPASGGQTVIGADVLSWNGVYFSTGIAFAFSTTLGTYTAGSAGDQNTMVAFK